MRRKFSTFNSVRFSLYFIYWCTVWTNWNVNHPVEKAEFLWKFQTKYVRMLFKIIADFLNSETISDFFNASEWSHFCTTNRSDLVTNQFKIWFANNSFTRWNFELFSPNIVPRLVCFQFFDSFEIQNKFLLSFMWPDLLYYIGAFNILKPFPMSYHSIIYLLYFELSNSKRIFDLYSNSWSFSTEPLIYQKYVYTFQAKLHTSLKFLYFLNPPPVFPGKIGNLKLEFI